MTTTLAPYEESIQRLGLAARYGDVAAFSEAVHSWKTKPYQDSWALALEEENKLLIICPPDTYKSSTIQCFIEQVIGKDTNIRILWLMKAGAQSQARVMAVAETIESNAVYHEAFPEVKPNKDAQWSHTALYVQRSRHGPDPTLMGCGFNGPYQGFHFDIIIVDDPTNQQDVRSPATMEDQRSRIRGVIYDRLVEGGRFIAMFTRWGEDDLVPVFEELGFKIVTMPIMGNYPWGPTIDPVRFSPERCAVLRHDKTPAIFDLTFMCNPSAMDGGVIKREYLHYWNNSILPQSGVVTIMACDPAASTRSSADNSAIATGLLEVKTRQLYVTDIWAGRVDTYQLQSELEKRAKGTANLVAIGLETKGFQLTFMQRLKRESHLPFRELPYRTRRQATSKVAGLDNDKTSRAVSLAQGLLSSRVLLPENSPYVDGVSLETELCSFPFGKHDDRMDVLEFLHAMGDTYSTPRMRVKLGHN